MKVKSNYIIIFFLAIIALIINVTLFYIPHIKGDFTLNYSSDERLQVHMTGGDYLEVYFAHDYWKDLEGEYQALITGQPQTDIIYKTNPLTRQYDKIVETIENDDIKLQSTLSRTNSKNFSLKREYEIKNTRLVENIDTTFMQLVIGAEFHSFTTAKNKFNLTQCNLRINHSNQVELKYIYRDKLLEVSYIAPIQDGTYTINLDFNIDCEQK
jgi:hypothetical protein